jgi:hypothetical protein
MSGVPLDLGFFTTVEDVFRTIRFQRSLSQVAGGAGGGEDTEGPWTRRGLGPSPVPTGVPHKI